MLCMLGGDREERSGCFEGAVILFINNYRSDEQANALCESVEAELRAACFRPAEEYYETLQF